MICTFCRSMLRTHQGRQWRDRFDLSFDHHVNQIELEESANSGCCICRSILCEISQVRARIGSASEESQFVSAYLSEIYDGLYRLDFKLWDYENVGTFVLQKIPDSSVCNAEETQNTPCSRNTSSDEVLQLAKVWINKCRSSEHPRCPGIESEKTWYPTRLLDLGETYESGKSKTPSRVRLVLTKEEPVKDYYVTLSHCWGKAQFLRLVEDNISEFRKGIEVASLPLTFQHAIDFARRLGTVSNLSSRIENCNFHRSVRYIWIDSLCIIQGNREDWLSESAQMYQIYNNSYCNISATAALDSDLGLFVEREPHELWDDEIDLNISGLPAEPGQVFNSFIHRCSIDNLSFWDRNIDNAPVNRRGWVFQERLMAPRVVHFCQNQIAFECRELEAAEFAQNGVSQFRTKAGQIVAGGTLKGIVPHPAPEDFNETTRVESSDPDFLDIYDRWKWVVEAYSKTNLTNPGDKLIALSGIAKMMSDQVHDTYIAGLWRRYLPSQLLWRVDPVFENGSFKYLSERSKVYRAPTFSWAAIDAQFGITYGEITEDGLLITVDEDPEIILETSDPFGVVKFARIHLKGVLKKIEMKIVQTDDKARLEWNLVDKTGEASTYTHRNVCLDNPCNDSDNSDILGYNSQVYCLPARKTTDDYLICLLLQLEITNEQKKNYRRIGLAKIPPYDGGQLEMLALSGDESSIPYGNWDPNTGKHTLSVI